jgi:hypothetical protein
LGALKHCPVLEIREVEVVLLVGHACDLDGLAKNAARAREESASLNDGKEANAALVHGIDLRRRTCVG